MCVIHTHGCVIFSQLLQVYIYFATFITNVLQINDFSQKISGRGIYDRGSVLTPVSTGNYFVCFPQVQKTVFSVLHLLLLNQEQILL